MTFWQKIANSVTFLQLIVRVDSAIIYDMKIGFKGIAQKGCAFFHACLTLDKNTAFSSQLYFTSTQKYTAAGKQL